MIVDRCQKRVAVLAYHKIGKPPEDGWDTWYYIPELTFVEQMARIRDNDWPVINCGEFLAGLRSPEALPDFSILLTFDDGHQSLRKTALPILQSFGFAAICFVPTDYIGKLGTFDSGVEPNEPICDWDDLLELEKHGVAIQSHGVSHHWFSLLDVEQQMQELVQSKRVLEQGLNRPVEAFAFPYSDAGKDAASIGKSLELAGYQAAFLCGGGPSVNSLPIDNHFGISRLAMYRDTDLQLEIGENGGHAS